MIALGEAIREARKARRLTQAQLAQRVGLKPNYCCMVERGSPLSVKRLVDFAVALGVRASDLVRRAEELEQERKT